MAFLRFSSSISWYFFKLSRLIFSVILASSSISSWVSFLSTFCFFFSFSLFLLDSASLCLRILIVSEVLRAVEARVPSRRP